MSAKTTKETFADNAEAHPSKGVNKRGLGHTVIVKDKSGGSAGKFTRLYLAGILFVDYVAAASFIVASDLGSTPTANCMWALTIAHGAAIVLSLMKKLE